MKKVRVNLKKAEDRSYDILVGAGLLERIGPDLAEAGLAARYVVVSDANVAALYGEGVLESLEKAGLDASLVVFPPGEKSKCRDEKARIEDALFSLKLGRDSALLALGGGVTGDLSGYVAATYNRGIPFVQVPTTLLAMADSSVGGKVGIDTPAGKNLLGAFHQPWRVYIDVKTLDTLPEREVRAGLAEVIKHAIIRDAEFLGYLENNLQRILSLDAEVLEGLAETNCAIKGAVVEEDEKEGDLRKILNFGHTLGHAMEKLSDYEMLHGEAVGVGMVLELRLAEQLGFLAKSDLDRASRLLERAGLGLPERLPGSPEAAVEATRLDKKARGGRAEYVLPEALGRMKRGERGYGIPVEEEEALSLLKELYRTGD